MKEIWTLIIKTSLPETCKDAGDIKTTVTSYEKFDDAKAAMQKELRQLAFSNNTMFDGKGHISCFERYIEDMCNDGDEEYDDDVITKKTLKKISRALHGIFSGKNASLKLDDGFYTDWMIGFEYKDGVIKFSGEDDGPCNGYNPTLYTNVFDLTEEKDYFLYINDLFGQDDFTSELYIDIKKSILN